jgi:hypothetical protein
MRKLRTIGVTPLFLFSVVLALTETALHVLLYTHACTRNTNKVYLLNYLKSNRQDLCGAGTSRSVYWLGYKPYTEEFWFDSRQGQEIFLFSNAHCSVVAGAVSSEIKPSGCQADNSTPSRGEEWVELLLHSTMCLNDLYSSDNFTVRTVNTSQQYVAIRHSPVLLWFFITWP